MCTIYTFDADFYAKNKAELVANINRESWSNSEGFSLLMIGEDEAETTLIRAMNIYILLDVMDAQFSSGAAHRAWLHLRMATTGFVGLNGCHGFAGREYSVFHNGVLSRAESDLFNVDSELIADDIQRIGKERAMEALAYDTYANVFIVNNETGAYHVVRRKTGSLYTDGLGNYATNPVGEIMIAVEENTRTDHMIEIVYRKPVKVSKYASRYAPGGFDWDEYEYGERITSLPPHGAAGVSRSVLMDEHLEDLDDEIQYQIDALRWAESLDDFTAMAEYEGWIHKGLPDAIRENMNVKQLKWAQQLGMLTLPMEEKQAEVG